MANIHIPDSYLTPKADFDKVLAAYKKRHPGNEVFRFRTPFSIKTEWATHNALYALGIRREQTKDLDLNYPQKVWERLAYPFIGCVVWPFIK